MNCKMCGKEISRTYPGNMCQGCYRYFHNGGTINPLPGLGMIEKDERGYVVCHICGRAYVRLGSHIKESHSMSIDEYKLQFGLCHRAKTTEQHYSKHMRENAYINDMPTRLLISGENTRIKPGETNKRKNKPVRMQEIINKRARYKSPERSGKDGRGYT